jgi:hypothetical protein
MPVSPWGFHRPFPTVTRPPTPAFASKCGSSPLAGSRSRASSYAGLRTTSAETPASSRRSERRRSCRAGGCSRSVAQVCATSRERLRTPLRGLALVERSASFIRPRGGPMPRVALRPPGPPRASRRQRARSGQGSLTGSSGGSGIGDKQILDRGHLDAADTTTPTWPAASAIGERT